MNQKNLTTTEQTSSPQDARKELQASRWLVDSVPLTMGAYNMAMAHGGCDVGPGSGAPVTNHKTSR